MDHDRIFQLEPEDPRYQNIIYNLPLPMVFQAGWYWYIVDVYDNNMGGLFIYVSKKKSLSYSLHPSMMVSGSGVINNNWGRAASIQYKPLPAYINHHNCQNRKVWWAAYENY